MIERVKKSEFIRRVGESWENWHRQVILCPRDRLESPGFYGERSLRDVIMHVAWYERQMVGILESRRFEGSSLWELPTDERNAIIHGENADRDLDDILGEASSIHARLMELLETLTDDELNDSGAFPGMPAEWAPWDVLAGNTYEHYDGHAESMPAWLTKEDRGHVEEALSGGASAAGEPSLPDAILETVLSVVERAETATVYRTPLVGFAAADDPSFRELLQIVGPEHALPSDLLEGAVSVVSFFLPFAAEIVEANRVRKGRVAREWAQAYLETNVLIGTICDELAAVLAREGFRSAAAPATGNFDRLTLRSAWSQKSVAIIAGLGRFGLHHMVITERGCAGRFGSLVTDAPIEPSRRSLQELCENKAGGTCKDCITRCPVGALNGAGKLDKDLCWRRCQAVAKRFEDLGLAEVCGKCAVGRCSMEPPVRGE